MMSQNSQNVLFNFYMQYVNLHFASAIKDKQYSSDFTLYKKQFEQK